MEGDEQAEPVIRRELMDASCANSARLDAAMVTGQPLMTVGGWVASTAREGARLLS